MANLVFSFVPTPPSSVTTKNFGALTRSGAGGIALPAGATSISDADGTNLTVTGGYVVPASNGVTSGTIVFNNAVEWEINAQADTYSARTAAELITLINLGATLSGKTVKLRPGSYGSINPYGSQKSYTSVVTFEADDASNKPVFSRWVFAADGSGTLGNVTLRNLQFDVDGPNVTGNDYAFVSISQFGSRPSANITIDSCDFNGNLPAWYLGHPQWNEISVVNTRNVDNLAVQDCTAINCVNFAAYIAGTNIDILRNRHTRAWGDFIRIGVTGNGSDTANVVIADNQYYDWVGNYDTYRHGDFIQGFDLGGTSLPGGDITDVQVLRNIMFTGPNMQLPGANGSANPMQFILAQGLVNQQSPSTNYDETTDCYRRWTIRGNVAEMFSVHACTFEVPAYDMEIEGNTWVQSRRRFVQGATGNVNAPVIQGWFFDSTIRQNFATFISGIGEIREFTNSNLGANNNTISDNFIPTYSVADDTALATYFQGPTFIADTVEDFLSQLRMKANGPLDADNSGGPTVGDVGALGTTTSNGIADFVNRTINTALIG
jgi:hypothetical protein